MTQEQIHEKVTELYAFMERSAPMWKIPTRKKIEALMDIAYASDFDAACECKYCKAKVGV